MTFVGDDDIFYDDADDFLDCIREELPYRDTTGFRYEVLTDDPAKVLVTPTWKIEGAVAKVEACNNGFDAVPTWEDITAMVQINRVYNFTNKTKTASKWGVNIRFTITKNEGFEGEVSISGFGGAYE